MNGVPWTQFHAEGAAMTAEDPDPGAPTPLDGVAAVLWGTPSPGRRGPKPKFTVEQIADAGIEIADREGLAAVTMQHVGDRLGVAKMALYRYVPGRTELEALMLDRALGAPGDPGAGPAGPEHAWQARLARWALALHARAVERPWSVELAQRPHLPGPNELAWFEAGLSAMRDLALAGSEKLDTLVMLVGHVAGIVRQTVASGSPEGELARALAPVLEGRADYPLTTAAFVPADEAGRDDALRFGIGRMIAGVEALARERSAG
jgi:AcrR family transcriptional regulator